MPRTYHCRKLSIMRKILIPTDFSIKSLELMKSVVEFYPNEMTNVMLMYPYRVPIWDPELYRFSEKKVINELTNDSFHRTKNSIVNENYLHINSAEIELLIGTNSFAFQNFRDQHQIHNAIIPAENFLNFSESCTFNPISLIEKNIANIHRINSLKDSKVESTKKPWLIKQLFSL